VEFLTVDAEFRRQWADDESLDQLVGNVNAAVRRFQMAFFGRNGNSKQIEEIFRPIQIFMLPRSSDGNVNTTPVSCPQIAG